MIRFGREAALRWAGGLLAAVAAILSLACFNRRFVFDDLDLLAHAASGGLTGWLKPDAYGLWRPVKGLLFAVVTSVPDYHREVGAALSAGAAAFMAWAALRFARRFTDRPAFALLAAAIFLLSPTLVSTLGWFSCANIALMAGCSFMALAALQADDIRALASGAGWTLLAMLGYEGAIAVPALALAARVATGRPFLRPLLASSVAALVFIGLRLASGAHGTMTGECIDPRLTGPQLALASAWLATDHLASWFWPWSRQAIFVCLTLEDVTPVRVATGWMIVLGLLAAGFALRRTRPVLSLGLLWFPIAFAPMSNLLPVRSGPIADYFLTLPSFGLALLVAGIAAELRTRIRAGHIPAALLLFGRTAAIPTCFLWAVAWQDEATLLQITRKDRPGSWKADLALARILAETKPGEAYSMATEAGIRAPWASEVPVVLAHISLCRKDVINTSRLAAEAARLRPSDPYPLIVLAFAATNEVDQEQFYREALRRPWTQSSPDAVLNLSAILGSSGRAEEGWNLLQAHLGRMPPSPELYANLAATAAARGDQTAAEKYSALYRKLMARAGPASR